MTGSAQCPDNTDPHKLVRDGTDRSGRLAGGPHQHRVLIDGRRVEHDMVFAAAYARYLRFSRPDGTDEAEGADGAAGGDWHEFFSSDPLARIAVLAVEDVAGYRTSMQRELTELQNPGPATTAAEATRGLRAVFDRVGTLAGRIDELAGALPVDDPLRQRTNELIAARLSPGLRLLISCFGAGIIRGVIDRDAPATGGITILGGGTRRFALVVAEGLSPIWPAALGLPDWTAYASIDPAVGDRLYGSGVDPIELINHLARHNLFTAAVDAFLGGLAQLVGEAETAVRAHRAGGDHQPHYGLFLAFLEMLGRARAETDALPAKHLDFYYRRVLGLQERPAQPARAHVLVELAKHVETHLLAAGTLVKAGKNAEGADAHFAVERDLVANRAAVVEVRRLYRHPSGGPLPGDPGRLFADTVATTAGPWHPFAEKIYTEGSLTSIAMPPAEIGFAVASHHLWLAGGQRTITVRMGPAPVNAESKTRQVTLRCRLTTEKGWLDKTIETITLDATGIALSVEVAPGEPPIVPYSAGTHGYDFATALPLLLVQPANEPATLAAFADVTVSSLTLAVRVAGLPTLTLANDHGPVDPSKPFLPFGSTPTARSALIIGSKEALQKRPGRLTLGIDVMAAGTASGSTPTLDAEQLVDGAWQSAELPDADRDTDVRRRDTLRDTGFGRRGSDRSVADGVSLSGALPGDGAGRVVVDGLDQPTPDEPDLTPDVPYSTDARSGFVRVLLSAGFGTDTYPLALAKYIAGVDGAKEPTRPVLPQWRTPTLSYDSEQPVGVGLSSASQGAFFHLTPFGHTTPAAADVPLLPRFTTRGQAVEGECYLGVTGLRPPQNLALLVQVVDGTADPRVGKPQRHLAWTYLSGDRWVEFTPDAVADGTDGLLTSGIVTLAVPADASTEHTLLPRGRHWIRASVATKVDAVCRIREVAAQAALATSVGPAAAADSRELAPGTLGKLATPDAAVKALAQRYPTFGGRPAESTEAFATRVSERLRHKDRAIAIWDYEHLVLEAFPGIHSARCLNHTRYEPTEDGGGVYRELAPGHVTVVTIPDLAVPDARDPLRPSTSLRLLGEIKRFLAVRTSCFVTVHVRNPQFEQVRVDLRVRFRTGVDETFHVNRLRREITEFLSPWAFRGAARPSFNGLVRKSVLVDFIEERDYVDYLTDVRLFRRLPGSTVDGPDLDQVAGSRAISVLVSVPPAHHGVAVIHDDEAGVAADCGCAGAVG